MDYKLYPLIYEDVEEVTVELPKRDVSETFVTPAQKYIALYTLLSYHSSKAFIFLFCFEAHASSNKSEKFGTSML
ncbi:MAG: hypothetical protein HDT40_03890 [Lachnospiraceae bacterium]|nr:hypothetical protein [Lachnospiraceae bacterium]